MEALFIAMAAFGAATGVVTLAFAVFLWRQNRYWAELERELASVEASFRETFGAR